MLSPAPSLGDRDDVRRPAITRSFPAIIGVPIVGVDSPDRTERQIDDAKSDPAVDCRHDWLWDAVSEEAENEAVMASYYVTAPKRRMVFDRACARKMERSGVKIE